MKAPWLALIVVLLSPVLVFGQISFDQPTVPPGAGYPKSVVVGDFDGNGLEDQLVTSYVQPATLINVFYSNANGSHTVKKLNITNDFSLLAETMVGDLNKDGKDDFVAIQRLSNVMLVAISTGTDFNVMEVSLGIFSFVWEGSIVDYDNDGNLDIIVAGQNLNVRLFTNDGSGNFTLSTLSLVPTFSTGTDFDLHVYDFNDDDKKDFVTLSDGELKIYVADAGSDFSFSTTIIDGELFRTYDQPRNSVVADFDGNGTLDVVAALWTFDEEMNSTVTLSFFSNTAGGLFADAIEIPATDGAIVAIDHTDYDNDNKEDLILGVMSKGAPGFQNNLKVLHNLGDVQFEDKSPQITYWLSPQDVHAKDSKITFLSGNRSLEWLEFDGSEWSSTDRLLFGGAATGGVVLDMDNDGFKDIVQNAMSGPAIEILYGKGNFEFENPVFIPVTGTLWSATAADLNGDGYGDIMYNAGPLGPSNAPEEDGTAVILSTGPRTFSPFKSVGSSFTQSRSITTGDFDNDSDIDFFDHVTVFLNDGSGNFAATDLPEAYCCDLSATAAGHFNNDKFLDLVVSGVNDTYIYFNDGAGHFTNFVKTSSSLKFDDLDAVDLNADGIDEIIAVVNEHAVGSTAQISSHIFVFTPNTEGEAIETIHIVPDPSDSRVTGVSVADFDRDGALDIITGYEGGFFGIGLAVYRGLPGGGFDNAQVFAPSSNPFTTMNSGQRFSLADLDGDSRPDVVHYFLGDVPIVVYHNNSAVVATTESTDLEVEAANTKANVTLTKGNGTGRIIMIRKSSEIPLIPLDGKFYKVNDKIGENLVVSNKNEQTLLIENLEQQVEYVVSVFEYFSDPSGVIDYMSTGPSVTFVTRKPQTITFDNTDGLTLDGANIVVTASASSGLPVELTFTEGSGTIDEATFTPAAAGKITLHATQAGDNEFAPVEADITFCIAPVKPIISVSSDLVVLTSSSDETNTWYLEPSHTQVSVSKTFTPIADGIYQVVADVDGCSRASDNTEPIVVGPESKVSELGVVSAELTADVSFIKGNGHGRLIMVRKASEPLVPPTNGTFYQSNFAFETDLEIATISGLTASTDYIVTIFEYYTDGSTIINYSTSSASKAFRTRDPQTVSFTNTSGIELGTDNLSVSVSASSELPVELSIVSGDGEIDGDTFIATVAGKVTLHAKQAGNSENSAVETEITFCVNPLKPTITISSNGLKVLTSSSDDDNNTWVGVGSSVSLGTEKTYIPVADGEYQVQVEVDGCVNTSLATDLIVVGPPTPISNLEVNPTETTATVTFQKGDGNGRLITIHKATDQITPPTNGIVYNSSTAFGTDLETATINGLIPATGYIVVIYEYYSLPSKNIINYSATGSVIDFTTLKSQTITFSNTSNIVWGEENDVTASSSSGLPVAISILSGKGIVDGNKFTPIMPGVVTLQATTPANEIFSAGVAVTQFCVYPPVPKLTLTEDPAPLLTSTSDANIVWYLDNAVIKDANEITYTPTKNGVYKVSVDVEGCANVSDPVTFIHAITGLEDEFVKSVSLYPNPAKDFVRINLPESVKALPVFFNTIGQQFNLTVTRDSNSIEVNVSELPAGLYIAKIQNVSLKFIKQQ